MRFSRMTGVDRIRVSDRDRRTLSGPSLLVLALALAPLFLVGLGLPGCGRGGEIDLPLSLSELAFPGAGDCMAPNLTAGEDGRVYLSWVERIEEERSALHYAVFEGSDWVGSNRMGEGRDWFVNWADIPTMAVGKSGAMWAHWLEKNGPDTYAYGIRVSRSADGRTWSPPMTPHRDGTETEHGFVSMAPWSGGRLFLIWLDGRKFAGAAGSHDEGGAGEMTLRSAVMDGGGSLDAEFEIDGRVCDCCATAVARTPTRTVVAYRDRSTFEIRDISYVVYRDDAWSEPRGVHPDMWKIAGCPVNGPALASAGEDVAVAWFTAAKDVPRVKLAWWREGGPGFEPPVVADDGDPLGRVDLSMLPDRSALICWLEGVGDGAEVRLRRVAQDGSMSPSMTVTVSTANRASGLPRMAYQNGWVYLAWTIEGETSTIGLARGRLDLGE